MGHDDHDPARQTQYPVKGFEHWLERVHVLDAEHKHGGVIAALVKLPDRGEPSSVADHETARAPMAAPGSLDEPRTRIDTRVARTGPDHCRRQHALPCPDVEDLLAIAWIEQVERDGQHDTLVVATPLTADPAVVPGGLAVPRGGRGRRSARP